MTVRSGSVIKLLILGAVSAALRFEKGPLRGAFFVPESRMRGKSEL